MCFTRTMTKNCVRYTSEKVILSSCGLFTLASLGRKPVVEKLQVKKKFKKILTANISEIYGPILPPIELDRELSKIYLYNFFFRKYRYFNLFRMLPIRFKYLNPIIKKSKKQF